MYVGDKAVRFPNLRSLWMISKSGPDSSLLPYLYKEAMTPIFTDLNQQHSIYFYTYSPISQNIQISIMYSDIILQTFDAFQAQQSDSIKAQHVAKNDTHHRSQQRHRLLSVPGLGHSLSIRSLSSSRSQHGDGEFGQSEITKVERAN